MKKFLTLFKSELRVLIGIRSKKLIIGPFLPEKARKT